MTLRKIIALGVAVVALAATTSAALAETLLMPNRDARTTAPVVVWGVHTQAAGTACSLDFGDGTAPFNCTGVDRSYIAQAHTYALQNTYTVTLTVGAEVATTAVRVFNPALFADGGAAGASNRSLGINMAIQDGLRWLWTQQDNRVANFPGGTTTSWSTSGFSAADTSLVVLAFENQGFRITANVAPTGIFEKYIVRRGLNHVLSRLTTVALGNTPAGDNPCVGVPVDANVCQGLKTVEGDDGYTTATAILGLAGSGALAQINTEVAGVTNGKSYGEVLQRLVNALAWGQNDAGGSGRGGWDYSFNSTFRADGSTIGWDVLALLDAAAAGATVPVWVKTEFAALLSIGGILNSNGSFDYVADNNATNENSTGPQKVGIGLQGLFLIGETSGARVDAVRNNIDSWWNGGPGIGQNPWFCGASASANKGCAYSMFNNFKGLKLQNIVTLPSVARPAGPGTIPAGDWYADYVDWLVTNQTGPSLTNGGNWSTMGFSCCHFGSVLPAAVAELILSPVALVAPDPTLFSTVGLSPATATNPVGTSHTVTAFTQAANGAPVPGVTIEFRVVSGPNAGKTGTGSTGADGKVSFTYTDTAGPGTDTIQAFIGTTLASNQVTKTWANPTIVCDVNSDGKVTSADLLLIRAKSGQSAGGANAIYDANTDGAINVADVRYCQLRLTPP
ncbi:MAG: dockerin type I domain-containing protein [Steroidobacteraceae bacterium]|nr:dockerin type I domain-containing protein [Steroidobacteraceae bacterium]